MDLKALAEAVLTRNRARNRDATKPKKARNFRPENEVQKLRGVAPVNWTPDDWRMLFDERAGIAEFDGGLPRAEAEKLAFDECVDQWMEWGLSKFEHDALKRLWAMGLHYPVGKN